MLRTTIPIQFHFANVAFNLRDRKRLKHFITKLFEDEGVALEELHYIFCSDAYLLQINKKFLNHNTYTDIITFSLAQPGEPVISDIYISTERVRDNASMYKSSFPRELHRVIFHGALHLCGYKDKTKQDKKQMREKEDFYLNRYFVPRGTN